MKKITVLLLLTLLGFQTFSQETSECPYRLNAKVDIPIIALGIGGTIYGAYLRQQKSDLDSLTVINLDPSKLSSNDRKVTKEYDPTWGRGSDFLLASGFLVPFGLLIDDHIRSDAGIVGTMFLETMAITGMGYWGTAGSYDKIRPYAYNPEVPFNRRKSRNAKNSFYGGHPSVTAAGLFFMAQVYSDYHPESNWKYLFWTGASAATLANAYLRYKGGFHFPSDLVIGVAAGTATGILVPILHRKKKETKVTVLPYFNETAGLYASFKLK